MTFTQLTDEHERIIREFHILFTRDLAGNTWTNTTWKGIKVSKCALDLWIYQEIIWETQPDVIIETGTSFGGSAMFMADMLAILPPGKYTRRVITVDVHDEGISPEPQAYSNISFVKGDSVEVAEKVRLFLPGLDAKVMVNLDSAHSMTHVLGEMRLYGKFVTPGQYMIVEDTNVNGHPVIPDHGPGPAEAVAQYLQENDDFEVDWKREKFAMTFNPGGYLRKKSCD